jgi:hypothetical protein
MIMKLRDILATRNNLNEDVFEYEKLAGRWWSSNAHNYIRQIMDLIDKTLEAGLVDRGDLSDEEFDIADEVAGSAFAAFRKTVKIEVEDEDELLGALRTQIKDTVRENIVDRLEDEDHLDEGQENLTILVGRWWSANKRKFKKIIDDAVDDEFSSYDSISDIDYDDDDVDDEIFDAAAAVATSVLPKAIAALKYTGDKDKLMDVICSFAKSDVRERLG